MKLESNGKVRLRIISHNTARDWHDCTPEFAQRLIDYCRKSKADIWIQLYRSY